MKIALGIEYDGSGFHGWQTQSGVRSVQVGVEAALSRVAASPITVLCAGRTDTGVHAYHQVVHFEAPVERSPRAWTLGANANLPPDISVQWARPVPEDFHARYSATSRRYRYVVCNRATRAALWANRVTWECQPLMLTPMVDAARALVGEHDFSSFRAAGCQAKHAVRTVLNLALTQVGDYFQFDIEANAFLQHMVRNIMGTLFEVGRGHRSPNWVEAVLKARDRREAGMTAPAAGLYFLGARYPERFEIPEAPVRSPFDECSR
ncbi:MAG: tRNA pseudouridine(38-40) synthase TruA [Gammaproteobacteria bacterium]|nr:tRNA pseudouridine(38-40) synthase TruA [Gammaproteobacteria bacterium]